MNEGYLRGHSLLEFIFCTEWKREIAKPEIIRGQNTARAGEEIPRRDGSYVHVIFSSRCRSFNCPVILKKSLKFLVGNNSASDSSHLRQSLQPRSGSKLMTKCLSEDPSVGWYYISVIRLVSACRATCRMHGKYRHVGNVIVCSSLSAFRGPCVGKIRMPLIRPASFFVLKSKRGSNSVRALNRQFRLLETEETWRATHSRGRGPISFTYLRVNPCSVPTQLGILVQHQIEL